jgi:signal transduction histidine kinase/ActR/RegA family two-component response regulator
MAKKVLKTGQAEEGLRKRVEGIPARHANSLDITVSRDLSSLLEAIVERAVRLLNTTGGCLYRCQPQKRQVECVVSFQTPLDYTGHRFEYGQGAAGIVAQTGAPLIVNNYLDWPDQVWVSDEERTINAVLTVPILWHGEVNGVFQVMDRSETRKYTVEDRELLALFADQAAIAIENARLFAQAAAERRHLDLLYDIARELSSSMDVDSILDRAIGLTNKTLGGLVGEAFLYLPEKKTLSLRGLHGHLIRSIEEMGGRLDFKLGAGLAGWVAETRQPVIVPDISREPHWVVLSGLNEDVVSAIAAPILDDKGLLGVMTVLHTEPAAFNDDHLELLKAICQQVSLALSNAQRYQQVQNLVDLLETEQNRLESLIEWLPVGVLLLDDNFNLLVANEIGVEHLAALSEIEIGERLVSLGGYSLADLTSRHADPLPVELHLEGPPASVFEVQARPIGEDQVQWVLTLRDVTRERENQVRIQMQERLATVGQLAAGIAHDFNNIMAAILVYTDLLSGDLKVYPASRERLAIIREQVQRAASLIRQILDFSRRSVMEQSTLDLLPFLKELNKLLRRVLPETIHLELVCLPGVYQVTADPTRLQQVFMNLALNASDAMPEGGDLRFSMDIFQLRPEETPPTAELPAGDWVRIIVSDTGVGIPAEALPHVFEPFFTTKPAGQGTGLGLAQVYGIIKQHNGYIDVYSHAGGGTTFVIYLPATAYAKEESYTQEAIPLFDGAGATVLLAEDDGPTRDALQALLETHNFHVLPAANGVEALDIFNQQPKRIALIISDVVMPRMGGIALYREILKKRPGVKMLFMTGHPLGTDDQSVLEKGAVHWLQKPFSMQDFSKALQLLFTPAAGRRPSGKIKGVP